MEDTINENEKKNEKLNSQNSKAQLTQNEQENSLPYISKWNNKNKKKLKHYRSISLTNEEINN